MRKIFILFITTCVVFSVFAAETHVNITNPDTWTTSDMKNYSGQTIIFDNPMYIVNNYNNKYYISPRRIFTPTHIADPSKENCDYYTDLNGDGQAYISNISGYHRMGEVIYNLKAKISSTSSWQFVSGTWSGNTRDDLRANLPNVDQKGEHTILVCAMNLEYYLTEFSGTYDRGPKSKAEHEKQRTKISKALAKINADIYGLVEVQKGSGALKEIAEDLTKNTKRNFTYVEDQDAASGTYTKSGYVYCTDRVETASALQSINDVVSDRKKMIVFRDLLTREKFIFSLNHFKAKNGTSEDCQGTYNDARVKEANAVLTKYNKFKDAANEEDLLLMGDLNAYAKEDPIKVFQNAEFIDLHRVFHGDQSYSYTYKGDAGYLDHALCNASMYNQITGMGVYHINSDEKDDYTYQSSDTTMFRCSDHDPVLVGLKLKAKETTDVGINSIEVYYTLSDIVVTNAFQNSCKSYYRIYSLDGHLMEERNITCKEQHFESPSQPGIYLINIYYYDMYHNGYVKHYKIIVP